MESLSRVGLTWKSTSTCNAVTRQLLSHLFYVCSEVLPILLFCRPDSILSAISSISIYSSTFRNMAATTLSNSFHQNSNQPAVIVPSKPHALTVSYKDLCAEISSFQGKLAKLGISPKSAVSIALPNSYEFIIAFLATSWQRAIAAPLNSAYKQEEFEFYINDLTSALILVPRGEFQKEGPAVRAARTHNAAIAECYWDSKRAEVALDIKDLGGLNGQNAQSVHVAETDDVALVLHTSGTTGRPKAVSDNDIAPS